VFKEILLKGKVKIYYKIY